MALAPLIDRLAADLDPVNPNDRAILRQRVDRATENMTLRALRRHARTWGYGGPITTRSDAVRALVSTYLRED